MGSSQNGDIQSCDVSLSALAIPEGRLIAPRSFLVDRIAAGVEQILLPQSSTGGGTVNLQVGFHAFAPPHKKKRKAFRRAPAPLKFDAAGILIDLRQNSPENWAHFLTNHLAVLALICKALDKHWSDFTALLPAGSPKYLRALVELISLSAIYTDEIVEGEGVQYSFDRWNVIRGERGKLLRNPALNPLAEYLQNDTVVNHLPKRIFVSRRGTRTLKNETEVESILTPLGFLKLYPEDLDVSTQIRTILNADVILGVHGAGLAPVLYSTPRTPPKVLIELFPVGHITDVYRAAAAETGTQWCGVRGYIEPKNLEEIYALEQPYTKHSLSNFRIDPVSIETALNLMTVSDS